MAEMPPRSSSPPQEPQNSRGRRLAALTGANRTALLMRVSITLAVVISLVVILIGLLRPATPAAPTPSSRSPVVGLDPGDAAPNFTLAAPDNRRVSLSDYRGRPVLLNFWYATCPGCLLELPDLQKFYAQQQAAGKDTVILGVNVVDDAATIRQFAQQRGLAYPLLIDSGQSVETLYSVNAVPTSYFIDRRGIIRARVVGPLDEQLLAKNVALIS